MATFQAMLLVALQEIGTFVAVESPCPVGPRNSGQSFAPFAVRALMRVVTKALPEQMALRFIVTVALGAKRTRLPTFLRLANSFAGLGKAHR